jgi:hypothetical protein
VHRRHLGQGRRQPITLTLCHPVGAAALSRDSEDLRIAIDADDRAGRANQLTGQHRDVAGATTQIENPHAALDARVPQQALGGRLENRRLLDQAPDLILRMSENIYRVTHATYSRP